MKTLVLVLSTWALPYRVLIRTIKQTWASVAVSDVATIFYYGGAGLHVNGDELILPVPDGYEDIGRKTIACFEYVLRTCDFDVVFRTNCSSYVDLRNLRDYAQNHATPAFYSGVVGGATYPWVSGSGYFLSRDLVELVVEQRSAWNHRLADDWALGELLVARNGVQPTPAPRQDFRNVAEVAAIDTSLFHFRCKTYTWRRVGDRRILWRVHGAFCAVRGLPVPSEDRSLRALGAIVDIHDVARRALRPVVRIFR